MSNKRAGDKVQEPDPCQYLIDQINALKGLGDATIGMMPDRSDDGELGEGSEQMELPFIKKFADIPEEEEIPALENDYTRSRAYLLRQYLDTGDNLWDHLNELLKKILSERPKSIADIFEQYSLKVRKERFRDQTDHLHDLFVPPEHYNLSQKLMTLLRSEGGEGEPPPKNEEDEDELAVRPDLMELLYFFEQCGVGLPRHEMFCIALHIKKLSVAQPIIQKYRFWGKVIGLHLNYYVVEVELSEEEVETRNTAREEEEERIKAELEEANAALMEEEAAKRELELEEAKAAEEAFAVERTEALYAQMIREAEDAGLEEMPEPPPPAKPWPVIPPLPVAVNKIPPEIPAEPIGVGVNRKQYFVCSGPGDDWTELPDVTPQQIIAARLIKRSFTGYLDNPVVTYPEFPGDEKNLLRAQIARISGATQISPLGFYTFNEEEEPEDEEEDMQKTNYMENPSYEPISIPDLTDKSMAFWVHHTQYILKQGRTSWWNPKSAEEGEEGEEGEGEGGPEKEVGPELLTPLSEDTSMDAVMPWSSRSTSPKLFPELAVAVTRSNIWPGAYAFATNKKFDNVYIGYGHKFAAYNHSPLPLQPIQEEYPLGPEIMEISDPTPEEEEAWRLAHLKPDKMEEGEEEEGGDDDE